MEDVPASNPRKPVPAGVRFDRRLCPPAPVLVGVDEAGRGAWAGPVVAAAVAVDAEFLRGAWVRRFGTVVDDSKVVTAPRRLRIHAELRRLAAKGSLRWRVARVEAAEIEATDILAATRKAMASALAGLAAGEGGLAFRASGDLPGQADLFAASHDEASSASPLVLVDGRPLRPFPYEHRAIVDGDAISFVIGLASILAKVERDLALDALDRVHPGYGFGEHKGYGTAAHQQALRGLGPCAEHRPLFLRKHASREAERQSGELFGEAGFFG